MFFALRQVGPESDPRAASVDEVLQQARVAIREPRDAGIHTLFVRRRLAIYLLGEERTRRPWIASETVTWYEAPDRKRVEIEFAAEGEAPDGSAVARYSQTEVWDGADHWTHTPGISAVTVRRQEQRGSAFGLGKAFGPVPSPSSMTDPAASRHCATPAMTGEQVVSGRDAWVVEFGRSRCGLAFPGEDGRRVMWIDKATGLALREESYSADGRLYSSAEITHLTIKGAIDPDRFRFVAPGDAVLHDYRGIEADMALLESLPFPTPLSLAQAKAEATFGVLIPTAVPRGFELESIEHYWDNEHARALGSHADWLRLRYANAAGDWLVIEQGFGGPLALFAASAPALWPTAAEWNSSTPGGATQTWRAAEPNQGANSSISTLLIHLTTN